MRSFSFRPLLPAFFLVLVFCSAGAQQRYVTSNASIPFPFYAGGQVFPAGEYVFDSAVPATLSIHSKDGKIHGFISTVRSGEPVKRTDARLIFVKRNGRYVLRELWGVLGKYITTAEFPTQGQPLPETQEIRLTFPG